MARWKSHDTGIGAGFPIREWMTTPATIAAGCVGWWTATKEHYDPGGTATDFAMDQTDFSDSLWGTTTSGTIREKLAGGTPQYPIVRFARIYSDGTSGSIPTQYVYPDMVIGERVRLGCYFKPEPNGSGAMGRPIFYTYGGPFEWCNNQHGGEWRHTRYDNCSPGFTTTQPMFLLRNYDTTGAQTISDWDWLTIEHLSYDTLTSHINSKQFTQTTVSYMPWREYDPVLGREYVCSYNDAMTTPGPVTHVGPPWTIALVVRSQTQWNSIVYWLVTTDSGGTAEIGIRAYNYSTGTGNVSVWDNKDGVSIPGTINNGLDWTSVILTVDSTGNGTLYVNGAVSGTMTGVTAGLDSSVTVKIGNYAAKFYQIADVAIYDRDLTADEVASLARWHRDTYRTGYHTPRTIPSLVYWYGFHKGSGVMSRYHSDGDYLWFAPLKSNASNEVIECSTHLPKITNGGIRFSEPSISFGARNNNTDYGFITTGNSTVAMWANVRDASTSQLILGTNMSGSASYDGFRWHVDSGNLNVIYTDGSGNSISLSAPISTGRHSIMTTFDAATQTVDVYIDKVKVGSASNSSYSSSGSPLSPLIIGDSGSYYIRDWTIRNLALYQSKVTDLTTLHKALRRTIYE